MLIKLPGMDMFIPILEIRKWSSEKLRDLARVTQLKKKKKTNKHKNRNKKLTMALKGTRAPWRDS